MFLVTLPLAVVALVMALKFVPSHVNEATDPVDNLGGVLSALMVGALILGINFAAVPDKGTLAIGLGVIAAAAARRVRDPPDAARATRSTTSTSPRDASSGSPRSPGSSCSARSWPRCSSVSSSCRTCSATTRSRPGPPILPAVILMVIVRAALGQAHRGARGSRFTLLCGYVFCFLGFLTMLTLWDDRQPVLAGRARRTPSSEPASDFAGTPASHSLTGSVPVRRAGMASATADLQRDLGGAIMQSILGALLTAGYAAAFTKLIAGSPNAAA